MDSVIHLSNNWGQVFSCGFLLLPICYPNDTRFNGSLSGVDSIHFNDLQCTIMLTSKNTLSLQQGAQKCDRFKFIHIFSCRH